MKLRYLIAVWQHNRVNILTLALLIAVRPYTLDAYKYIGKEEPIVIHEPMPKIKLFIGSIQSMGISTTAYSIGR